MRDTVSR